MLDKIPGMLKNIYQNYEDFFYKNKKKIGKA